MEFIDINPILLLKLLYKEWAKKVFYLKNFKSFIISNIENINKRLKLDYEDDEEENIKVPTEFYNKIKNAFNELYKNKVREINSKEKELLLLIYINFIHNFN